MVRVNVQSSGNGDKLESEYAVRIIAARNESSRGCFCITAFAILFHGQFIKLPGSYGESISPGGMIGRLLTSQMNFSRGISNELRITRLILSTEFLK